MVRAKPESLRRDALQGGFTLLELIVVLSVLALLCALLLPAIGQARAAAGRMQCQNNLRQLAHAIANYESQYQMFPPGGTSAGGSTLVVLLPFLEQQPLYERYESAGQNPIAIISEVLPIFACPSESAPRIYEKRTPPEGMTNYSGNAGTGVMDDGYNGMFRHLVGVNPHYPEGPVRAASVRDGLSNTAMMSEVLSFTLDFARLHCNWNTPKSYQRGEREPFLEECNSIPENPTQYGWMGSVIGRGIPWTQGELGYTMYNHLQTPGRPSCYNGTSVQTGAYTAASLHSGGVNVLFADGHLNFVANSADLRVWRDMGSRGDADIRF